MNLSKIAQTFFATKTRISWSFIGGNLLLLTGVYFFQGFTHFGVFLLIVGLQIFWSGLFGFYIFRLFEQQLHEIATTVEQASLEKKALPALFPLSWEKRKNFQETLLEQMSQYGQQIQHWKTVVQQVQSLEKELTEMEQWWSPMVSAQEHIATTHVEVIQKALIKSREVATTAREVVSHAIQAIEVASQASRASKEGISKMRDASSSMEEVKKDVERILHQITNLHEHSQRIYGVISIINEISNQINLLALNAAIEAAGAGQAGKRFSVVAKEIRRLANKTSEGTSEIEKLIDAMLEFTESSHKASERGKISAETTATKLMEVMKSLNLIFHYVENTDKVSQQISYSTQQQTSTSEQLSQVIAQTNEVALKFVKNTQEISSIHFKLESLVRELEKLKTQMF